MKQNFATPFFSIIIPTYNSLDKLKKTIGSFPALNPALFEFLVIDGASTDGTVAWLQSADLKGGKWISESDEGVYHAMNKGIHLSSGRFLYFLGAGDLLSPGILAEAEVFILNLPEFPLRFVYGNVRFMRDGGRIGDGRFDKQKMCDLNVCHQAIFYDRKIYELLGSYDLKYRIFSDWVYNLRCFGDSRIECFFYEKTISDYEGGGLSDKMVDEAFNQDRLRLIIRFVGWRCVLGYWYRSVLKPCLKKIIRTPLKLRLCFGS